MAVSTAIATVTLEEVRAVTASASLVMQAVVITGDKTKEGLLIEAVTVPWLDIVKLLGADPNAAFQIPPRKWEEIIAGAYKKAGFDEVTLTPHSGDYGRDIIAVKKGLGSIRVIDQVKAYKPDHLVTAEDVRALMACFRGIPLRKAFSRPPLTLRLVYDRIR
ncbi:HJR/Mrr/RecB family endonuclease [Bradyrhizobium sp. USDA 4472]